MSNAKEAKDLSQPKLCPWLGPEIERADGSLALTLYTVVDVIVKQFAPLLTTSSTIPCGIHQDRFP